jgi:hypothetical protein
MSTNLSDNKPYLEDGEYVHFPFNGVQFRVKFRRRHYTSKDKKSRMYVDLPEDMNDTLGDNLVKRDRGGKSDELKARRKAMRELAKEAHENLGHSHKGLQYSALAGCTVCPCSPGLIMNTDFGGDFYVASREAIRAQVDYDKEGAVSSAKYDVKKAKEDLKKSQAALKKAQAKLEEKKVALGEHKAKRRWERKAAAAKKAAEKKAA